MRKSIIIAIIGIILVGIAIFSLVRNESPTSYITKTTTSSDSNKITGAAVVQNTTAEQINEQPKGPVILSLIKGQDINLGYMPKELVIEKLAEGVAIKLGTIELIIGPFSDTGLLVALVGKNTNNIRLTDDIASGYETSDGQLEFLYKVDLYSKEHTLYVNRLTNPNNYPDAK